MFDYCPGSVEPHEIENARRSIVMLSPGQWALRREEAARLLEELAEVRARLDRLRAELRRLLAASD